MTTKQTITGFSLHEFLQKAQAKIQEGFVFDFESNENFPSRFGNVYECTMLPAPALASTAVDAEVQPESLVGAGDDKPRDTSTTHSSATVLIDAAEVPAVETPAVETTSQRKRKAA